MEGMLSPDFKEEITDIAKLERHLKFPKLELLQDVWLQKVKF